MIQRAPVKYVEQHYRNANESTSKFPAETCFWQNHIRKTSGRSVMNAGCGAYFYDDAMLFSECPETYVGVDVNPNTGIFLNSSKLESVVAAREWTAKRIPTAYVLAASFDNLPAHYTGGFDQVLGIGFFGIFAGQQLARMVASAAGVLKPGGSVLTVTWNNPRRAQQEHRLKVEYAYDTDSNPTPQQFVHGFVSNGFDLASEDILACDPENYGRESIQICEFRKSD